jgi:hypothetical protein
MNSNSRRSVTKPDDGAQKGASSGLYDPIDADVNPLNQSFNPNSKTARAMPLANDLSFDNQADAKSLQEKRKLNTSSIGTQGKKSVLEEFLEEEKVDGKAATTRDNGNSLTVPDDGGYAPNP